MSRWKVVEKTSDNNCSAVGATSVKKRLPVKILRYFPFIPRLQRMYMSKQMSKDMQWHKKELVNDGKMCHPADSKAWKHVDSEFKWFSEEGGRNVRLGLASIVQSLWHAKSYVLHLACHLGTLQFASMVVSETI
jgi:hypothetical protein